MNPRADYDCHSSFKLIHHHDQCIIKITNNISSESTRSSLSLHHIITIIIIIIFRYLTAIYDFASYRNIGILLKVNKCFKKKHFSK